MEITSDCSSYISKIFHLAGHPGAMMRETFFPNSSWIEKQMKGDVSFCLADEMAERLADGLLIDCVLNEWV